MAFGKQLLCDIQGADVAAYQKARQRGGLSGRTVNLEVGVLRSILRRYRMWEAIAPDVDFLKGESGLAGRSLLKRKAACSTLRRRVAVGASIPS